ncbi:hypothetical protein [Cereibacter sphaeroides]|uniref:hypothetical protein n=1 Tax=Cereibacter sphaeroides TaxID=1063 RepID=UPI0039E64A85
MDEPSSKVAPATETHRATKASTNCSFVISPALMAGLATVRFQRWTGIQIEARHREALHSAIMTAARVAVARGLTREVATEFVAAYVHASVPEAMKRLSPSTDTLDRLVRSKLLEVARH